MKSKQPDWKQQVMGRVWASAPSLQERQTLQALMGKMEADAAFLRRFGETVLAKELEEQAVVLRGIGVLSGNCGPVAARLTEPTGDLQTCYHHCMKRLDDWLLRSGDPQFAPVYAGLAEQTRRHCLQIARLMGAEKGRTKGGPTSTAYHKR